jgi:hypothetical protein
MKVNPILSALDRALVFLPTILRIPSEEISSLRQLYAVRKYVPTDLNAGNRSVISGAMCMGVGRFVLGPEARIMG